jgi:hypothetical protein
MRHFIASAALVMALVSAPALAAPADAQPTATPAAGVRLDLAKRYFAAIHYDQLVTAMSEKMIPPMLDEVAKANPKLTEQDRKAIIEATVEASKAFNAKFAGQAVGVIAETFSEAELKSMVDFYESDVGQSIMRKSQAMIPTMTNLAIKAMPAMQADLLQRLCAKIDCARVKLPAATAS